MLNHVPKAGLYLRAFERKLNVLDTTHSDKQVTELMSAVFIGVKAFNSGWEEDDLKDNESFKARLILINKINGLMSHLNPRQFVNTFPIPKSNSEDYHSTIEMMRTMEMNCPIGDKIEEFMFGYLNEDISQFQIRSFVVINAVERVNENYDSRKCSLLEWGFSILRKNLALEYDRGIERKL